MRTGLQLIFGEGKGSAAIRHLSGISGLCAEPAAGLRQGSCWAKTEPQPNFLGTLHWPLSVKLLGLPLFYIFYQRLPSSNLLRRYFSNVKTTTRLLYCEVNYPPQAEVLRVNCFQLPFFWLLIKTLLKRLIAGPHRET